MHTVDQLTLPLLLASGAAFIAILISHFGERFTLPAPALFLALGLAASVVIDPSEPVMRPGQIAQIGTVALVLILFEGGFSGGMRRMRSSLVPVAALGLVGTFVTTGALAGSAHLLLDTSWQTSILIGVALAPTDPAAVFSILGSRDVPGRSSAIIEGESGANDPVSIALMLGVLAYIDGQGSLGGAIGDFALQLVVGAIVGLALGALAGRALARVHLRAEVLFPFAAIASAFLVYSVTVLLHGSGFLAVLVAGLVMGDLLRRHAAIEALVGLGSALAEIVMFTILGLVANLGDVADALVAGLVMFGILTFLIRPLVVAFLLGSTTLARAERVFVAWGGLKGAVPVLLATFVLLAKVQDASRIFAIVFVAVAASIVVQGGTLPWVMGRLGLMARDPAA